MSSQLSQKGHSCISFFALESRLGGTWDEFVASSRSTQEGVRTRPKSVFVDLGLGIHVSGCPLSTKMWTDRPHSKAFAALFVLGRRLEGVQDESYPLFRPTQEGVGTRPKPLFVDSDSL